MSHCDFPGLMPIKHALELQNDIINVITDTTQVPLDKAANRILAQDVVATMQVPGEDNSAMDGYAIKTADSKAPIKIIGEALAGHPFSGELQTGQGIRIMTGAPVPIGADAVIMQEQTQVTDSTLICQADVKVGQSIRRAGEDIGHGSIIVKQGEQLSAAHLSLLASVGISEVEVYRKLKVAVMATGDELVLPGAGPLQPGQIFESNRAGLIAMLRKLPVDIVDFGIVPDDLDATRQAFLQASRDCDWVISSGGVSVGDADYVKQVLDEVGNIDFWKVAIKPGKPYAFGTLGQAYFSGLPGNPVSSFVTFLQLVLPSLTILSGATWQEAVNFQAKLTTAIKRRAGRTEFQRAIMWNDESGQLCVAPKGKQGSGIMNSFTNANCFLVIPADIASINEGDEVTIQPFSSLLG